MFKTIVIWIANKERWSRIFEQILLALLAAGIFFVIDEKIWKIPDLDGKWTFKTEILSNDKYKGEKYGFIALIQQSGQTLTGSAEKVAWEKANGKKGKDEVAKRSELKLVGYITKNRFSKDKVVIHFDEQGRLMTITTIQILSAINGNKMEGTFETTRGEHFGKVVWERGKGN